MSFLYQHFRKICKIQRQRREIEKSALQEQDTPAQWQPTPWGNNNQFRFYALKKQYIVLKCVFAN